VAVCSLFTNYPIVQRYITWEIGGVVRQTINPL